MNLTTLEMAKLLVTSASSAEIFKLFPSFSKFVMISLPMTFHPGQLVIFQL